MKKKDFCQECGKYMCKKKLRKSQVDKRLLCADCYKKENKERNGFGVQEEEKIKMNYLQRAEELRKWIGKF